MESIFLGAPVRTFPGDWSTFACSQEADGPFLLAKDPPDLVAVGVPDVQFVAHEIGYGDRLVIFRNEKYGLFDGVERARATGESQNEDAPDTTIETTSQSTEERIELICAERANLFPDPPPSGYFQTIEGAYLASQFNLARTLVRVHIGSQIPEGSHDCLVRRVSKIESMGT